MHEIAVPDADEILLATMQAIFLYDDIRLIEFQDYLGIGHRVSQAKRAGLLPPSVTVMAYVHGNHLYLDAAAGEIASNRPPLVDLQERLSVELADLAAFPSRYIRDLYVEKAGFRPLAERYLPYPIALAPAGLDELSRGPVRNLVFYGKQTKQKGYYDFVEAILALFSKRTYVDAASRIKNIVLMGVTAPDPRLAALPVSIQHGVWSRAEAVAMLRQFSTDSLVVLPYRGDNHPLSIFEVIDFDCQLLAFDIGGVPELLPAVLHDKLLCPPNPASLSEAIARAVTQSHWDRCQLVEQTRHLTREVYQAHIATYKETIAELKRQTTIRKGGLEPGAVTVVVPNLNGTRAHLNDVAIGLRNSFHRPAKVLLVDDGSTSEGIAILQEAEKNLSDISTKIILNPANLGLAGARNAGLAHVETPYICPHDNDNVILNRFLQIACRILDENPDVAAVTTWLHQFDDGERWEVETFGPDYRPLGADLSYALRTNILGDALGVYRVTTLRELGGWNETSKAKWEDWELFLRLVAAGKNVWVIPQHEVLYRVRQNSMLRQYPNFPAWLRLLSVFDGFPKAQAVSLLRNMWTPTIVEGLNLVPAATSELSAFNDEFMRLRAIEASTIWRATGPLRAALEKTPRLKRVLGTPLRTIWRLAREMRRLVKRG